MRASAVRAARCLACVLVVGLVPLPALAQEPGPPAELVFQNRTVVTFRSSVFGYPPAERARIARARIAEAVDRGGPGVVTSREIAQGRIVEVDGAGVFALTPADADTLAEQTLEGVTAAAVAALREAVAAAREQRSLPAMAAATGLALGGTAVYLLAVGFLLRGRRRLEAHLERAALERLERTKVIVGVAALQPGLALDAGRRFVGLASWLVMGFLSYVWLTFVFRRFPYTRPWGDELGGYLVTTAAHVGSGVVDAVPGLFFVGVIVLAARILTAVVHGFLERVASGRIEIGWLDTDTALPSRRLVTGVIWLFALGIAYPYLPGAGTQAFQGLSVLVGVMITLGGSSVVGQLLSGVTLAYVRVLRPGDFVQVADVQGQVLKLGLLRTQLRTGLGDEVSVPNSVLLSTSVRNFSRTPTGRGFAVQCGVTIGYGTPWRQVHAMLLEAARRTTALLAEPAPYVRQTALSDFYVEYWLVAFGPEGAPGGRGLVVDALNANVQDVFNEYGVQIMSPHYEGDPDEPQVVPKERWHLAPATRPPKEG